MRRRLMAAPTLVLVLATAPPPTFHPFQVHVVFPRCRRKSMIYSAFLTLFIAFPLYSHAVPLISAASIYSRADAEVSRAIRNTWENPSDTLSILLIIGGDVVLKALAQLSGRSLAPVAFSFGWVAYSFNTLMSVFGDGRLMPPPDCSAKVINVKSGFARENRSWVLGRLLRDFERPLGDDVGLCITVFAASRAGTHGVPSIDRYWFGGVVTIVVQIAIALIPLHTHGDWGILLITLSGTILALVTTTLPQWRLEKWACRRSSRKVICLTGGNGTRSAMVILGRGICLDLEDLAAAESPRISRRGANGARTVFSIPLAFFVTQVACVILAASWIVFLITVTGLDESAWYLMFVGGLGMVQNVVVAGARRGIGTSGIHLEKIEEFKQRKAMHTLMDVEVAYANVGRCLLKEFFPDERGLSPEEVKWWNGDKMDYDDARMKNYPDSLPSGDTVLSQTVLDARECHSHKDGFKTKM